MLHNLKPLVPALHKDEPSLVNYNDSNNSPLTKENPPAPLLHQCSDSDAAAIRDIKEECSKCTSQQQWFLLGTWDSHATRTCLL
mmetsp:Transcript_32340/g.54115  ORF Transcript_32340/g.54115 Transcript_32340/m.54115 type:complete len:84 (-) Transcript_32340:2669-2920(-)